MGKSAFQEYKVATDGSEDGTCKAFTRTAGKCFDSATGTAKTMTDLQAWTSATDSSCKTIANTLCRCNDNVAVTGTPTSGKCTDFTKCLATGQCFCDSGDKTG